MFPPIFVYVCGYTTIILCLDGPNSLSYFQVLHSLYQSFSDCTERTNYNKNYSVTLLFHSFYLFFLFRFHSVLPSGHPERRSLLFSKFSPFFFFFFFCWLSFGLVVWLKSSDQYVFQNPICISITPWEIFASVLADGFSLGFEWQQVSSSLQDSSQIFWPFSIMLSFFWSPLVLQLPSHPVL